MLIIKTKKKIENLHSFRRDLAFQGVPLLPIHPLLRVLLSFLLNPSILVSQSDQAHLVLLLGLIYLGFLWSLVILCFPLFLVVLAYQLAQQILGFLEDLVVLVLPSFL